VKKGEKRKKGGGTLKKKNGGEKKKRQFGVKKLQLAPKKIPPGKVVLRTPKKSRPPISPTNPKFFGSPSTLFPPFFKNKRENLILKALLWKDKFFFPQKNLGNNNGGKSFF